MITAMSVCISFVAFAMSISITQIKLYEWKIETAYILSSSITFEVK